MENETASSDRTVKHNAKDSIFTTLFKDVNNVYELYKDLHPEDKDVTVNDIQIETLKTVLINDYINDLGFIVNSGGQTRYVILVEAQSRWTENMTLRMLFYLSETYRRYLKESKQSEHSEKKVFLPKPEMYVVYTGSKSISDEISFSQTYFGGNSPIDLRVRVLMQIRKDTLYGQYIGFSKIYDEQHKLHKNKMECIKETIRICMEEGYLVAFLEQYKQEVTTMLSELFDEEAQREQYEIALTKRISEESEAKGRAEGRAEGEAKGILKTLVNLFKKGILTLAQAAEEAKMTPEEFQRMAAQQKK